MNVLIAPNSFKNCLDARDVAAAMARGVKTACPAAVVESIPLADGGDGLVAALAGLPGVRVHEVEAPDPLGRPVRAEWLRRDELAVIEMARASGMCRLKPDEYAPLRASSSGTGALIRAALDSGCRHIALGLGGSATVDGGAGMLAALGFGLYDANGAEIAPGGAGLLRLAHIDVSQADSRLRATRVTALVDVNNPLLGALGAARVFAPQKGADAGAVEILERGLNNMAAVLEKTFGINTADIPGAGAAGGLGAACRAALRAELTPGAQWVAKLCGFEAALARADLVLTGEGRLDSQTAFGKVPAYVAERARAAGKPVVALGGMVEPGLDLRAAGISECRPIAPPDTLPDDSIRNAAFFIEQAAAAVIGGAIGRPKVTNADGSPPS